MVATLVSIFPTIGGMALRAVKGSFIFEVTVVTRGPMNLVPVGDVVEFYFNLSKELIDGQNMN